MNVSKVSGRPAVLITGGACRIGRAVALAFARDGYDVALHYRSSHKEALATAVDIRRCGGGCVLLRAVLGSAVSGIALVRKAARALPGLSVLVHGASIFEPSGLAEEDIPALKEHMGVHVETAWGLNAAFRDIVGKGNILHFLDTSITRDRTAFAGYLLSKKALAELVRMSAASFAPDLRVNAVAPGFILPPKGKSAGYLRARAQQVPLRRQGSLDNICQALLFLVNNDYITGQTIFVDGGEHLI